MVGPRAGAGEAGMALPPGGYGAGMPDIDEQAVEEEKEDQVLKREGLEEELMQEGRSEEAETIAAVETGEENL